MTDVLALLLAAGAGRRMGGPKALVAGADGTPWVVSAARTLRAGGCSPIVVVVGAAAEEVSVLLGPEDVRIVVADDWAQGMGSSLRAGLRAILIADSVADAALVHLVDLPDVGADVVRRLVDIATPEALARATYGHAPGHPVLLGREHWGALLPGLTGDRGARDYLAGHDVADVDCSDLATGHDVDRPGPMLDG